MEEDWAGELEKYLGGRFSELCGVIGQPVPPSGLRINPALGVEESKYFLLGLDAGLFQPDELGRVRSELLPPLTQENASRKLGRLFWYDPPPPRLFRECVCQLSTASLLILKRGWLKDHIVMEPDFQDDRGISYGMDIVVRSPTGQMLICVEVKRSAAELPKLITDLRACGRRGAHAPADCGFPQNHPKYEFCTLYQPTYFWAVAPDADVCLRMKYDSGLIDLEQLPSLPPRSMIESDAA